jgi:uncharacterized membrane protein YecN with MAPEG domain
MHEISETARASISARNYAGPLLVTVAYVLWYYALFTNQLRVKTKLKRAYRARGEKFDRYFGADREMLAADRYVGNMLEHMPTFLLLLWLNAIFVGPLGATVAGAVYVGARVLYPFVMGQRLGPGLPSRILFATVVGYAVVAYFAGRLVAALVCSA